MIKKDRTMKTGIIIVTYRRPVAFLRLVLERIFKYSGKVEVVLVSNSEDEEAIKSERALQSEFPFAFLTNKSLMVLSARNQGTKHLFNSCDYFAEMDDDMLVTPNWLERILNVMESDPSIGIAVPLLPFSPAVWYQAQVVAMPDEVRKAMTSIQRYQNFNTDVLDKFWEETFLNKKSSYKKVSIPEVSLQVRSKKAVEAGLWWEEQMDGAVGPANAELARRTREAGFKIIAVKNSFVFHLQTSTHWAFQVAHPEIAGPMREAWRQYLEKKYGHVNNVYDEKNEKATWASSDGVDKFFEHSRVNLEE